VVAFQGLERDPSTALHHRGSGLQRLIRLALHLALIHRSVPWPGTGHPEAMKTSCSQAIFTPVRGRGIHRR
jgi:hypothetical protein